MGAGCVCVIPHKSNYFKIMFKNYKFIKKFMQEIPNEHKEYMSDIFNEMLDGTSKTKNEQLIIIESANEFLQGRKKALKNDEPQKSISIKRAFIRI